MAELLVDQKQVEKHAQAVELFAKLEQLSKDDRDVFDFFLSRYGTEMLDYYDWSRLWPSSQPASSWMSFMPVVSVVVSILVLIMLMVKK